MDYKDNDNRRDWHDDMSVMVVFFDKKQRLWEKKKVATVCHRDLFRVSNKSDFEEFFCSF